MVHRLSEKQTWQQVQQACRIQSGSGSPKQIWHCIQCRLGGCTWAAGAASLAQQETSKRKVVQFLWPGTLRQACRVTICLNHFCSLACLWLNKFARSKLCGSICNLIACCPRASSSRKVLDAVPNLPGVTRCLTESGKPAALVANFVYSTGVP